MSAEENELGNPKSFDHFPEIKPRMALSIGGWAVEFTEESGVITSGPDVSERFFGDDMGLTGMRCSFK